MRTIFFIIALPVTLLLSFQAYSQTPIRGKMNMSMIRHHYVMQHGIDAKYEEKTNPPVHNVTESKVKVTVRQVKP